MPTPENNNQSNKNEKNEFRKKIEEWKGLGFDTSELELLFNKDFEKFKKEHTQILRKQIDAKKKEKTPDKEVKGVTISPSDDKVDKENKESKTTEPSEEDAETIVIASIPEKKEKIDKIEETIDKMEDKKIETAKTKPKEPEKKEIYKKETEKEKTTTDKKKEEVKQPLQKTEKREKKEKIVEPKQTAIQDSNGFADIEIVTAPKKFEIDENKKTTKKKITSSEDTHIEDEMDKKKDFPDKSKYDKIPKKGNRSKLVLIAIIVSALLFFAIFGVNYINNTPPKLSLSISNPNPEIGENITINASIIQGSSKIVKYTWNFGDGTISRTMRSKAWHTYQSVGKFTITLSIEDEKGLGAKNSIEVYVKSEPFTVPPKKYGDKIIYDITTYGFLEGANGKPLY
ncbi:MAG: PKD domain-containing protein, partial [Thermoplasmata archaeon]